MNLKIIEEQTTEGLDRHGAAWDALVAASPLVSPVVSFSWMRAFLALRTAPDVRWTCLFAYDADRLVAVLPLVGERSRGIPPARIARFGTPRNVFHTTRVDLLASNPRALDRFVTFLMSSRRAWPILSLRGLPAGSPTLARAASGRFFVRSRPSGGENSILLPATFADYSARLDGKFLRELRRRLRKLEAIGSTRFLLRESSRTIPENLGRFVTVEDSGWKGDGHSSIRQIPGEEAFYLAAASAIARHGWLEWNFLELDGRTIAAHFALRNGRTLYILKIGYHREFSPFAPGNLLLWKTIEHAITAGDVDEINFLALCDWHADWNVQARPLHDATIFPLPRLAGRLLERVLHRPRPA
jgi:hypothetical protein